MKSICLPCVLLLLVSLAGCGDGHVYTLYRNSPMDKSMRIHIATFDASQKGAEAYNMENCEIAKTLFERQQGVTVKYWCEKGGFRN